MENILLLKFVRESKLASFVEPQTGLIRKPLTRARTMCITACVLQFFADVVAMVQRAIVV
jgi:hypothetical protein